MVIFCLQFMRSATAVSLLYWPRYLKVLYYHKLAQIRGKNENKFQQKRNHDLQIYKKYYCNDEKESDAIEVKWSFVY